MHDGFLTEIVESLTVYLSGRPPSDLKTREVQRQLANRVFLSLSSSESALLRREPAAHTKLLFGALSEAVRNDPVARHLATQLCAPEAAQPAQALQKPRSHFHIDISGNGNVVGDGNVIGSIGVPQAAEPQSKERRPLAIRILFLSANPDKMASLRADREVRDIQEALRQSEFRDRFELIQEPAVRISDLQRCLLQHRPDILHFSGHGDQGALILEDRHGRDTPLPGGDLADLLAAVLADRTRCVFLNACYSAGEAGDVAKVIPSVIARPDTISDRAAILFSTYFYQALAFGRSVREAFDLGCLQLRLEGWGPDSHPELLAQRGDPKEIRFAETAEEL